MKVVEYVYIAAKSSVVNNLQIACIQMVGSTWHGTCFDCRIEHMVRTENMTNALKSFALAAAIGLFAASAGATAITDTHTITASGPDTIGYTHFSLSTNDVVEIYTQGPTIDSVLYLLRDDGNLTTDDFIAYDDDSCPQALCGVSGGGWSNALITQSLGAGDYIAAVGDFALTLASVVSGVNTGNTAFGVLTGDVGVTVQAQFATVSAVDAAVPEPGSLALFALGTLLLPLFLRTKRRKP
jgi:PEP-CTERM motif-containing protein